MRRSILLLIFLPLASAAQIVNIESQRMQSDTTGWMGSLGASVSLIKNVQQITSVDALAHVQYKTYKNLWLFLASYDLLKARGQTFSSNAFYHLRYNYRISTWLKWEAFTQLQKNAVTGIDRRVLAGTGPRFRLRKNGRLRLYAGLAAMYEYEREGDKTSIHRDARSSNYLSFTYTPIPILELDNSFFYQPLFHRPADYRLLDELRLSVKAGRHLALTTTFNYLYDAFPAQGIPHVNYGLTNGLAYSF